MRLKQLVLSLMALLVFVAPGFADSRARIVRLSYIEGDVQLDRGEGDGYIRAFLNMPLIEGATLWTREDARAEIEFEDGSTVRLIPNTILAFSELRLRGDGSKVTTLDVRDGTTYFDLKRHDDDSFRVLVDGRDVSLEKSSEFRIIRDSRQNPEGLQIAVTKGELRLINTDGQQVAIRKNETLSIDFDEPARYYLARGIHEGPFDYWNKERDDDRETLARNNRNNVYLSDLNRYGRYFEVVGYGRVWRPYPASFAWDPFASGVWVSYPHIGMVWVSDYIWGWMPFRYGSWVHVGGHGWCWRPPSVHTAWVPVPAIVNPPSGYVGPVVPVGPRRPVIRVGRGIDDRDFPDERRRRGDDRPGILVQDRIRGVRQVDARPPSGGPIDISGRPVDGPLDRGKLDAGDRDRLRGLDRSGVDSRPRNPVNVDTTKGQPHPRDVGIDAARESETPARFTPQPSSSVAPTAPAARPPEPLIMDRPVRSPRVSPTPSTPPVRAERVSPPPSSPPPRNTPPPQAAPSSPAPRLNPSPPPPPPRSAPVRDGLKDQ